MATPRRFIDSPQPPPPPPHPGQNRPTARQASGTGGAHRPPPAWVNLENSRLRLVLGQITVTRLLGNLPRAHWEVTCCPPDGQRPARTHRMPGLRLVPPSARPPGHLLRGTGREDSAGSPCRDDAGFHGIPSAWVTWVSHERPSGRKPTGLPPSRSHTRCCGSGVLCPLKRRGYGPERSPHRLWGRLPIPQPRAGTTSCHATGLDVPRDSTASPLRQTGTLHSKSQRRLDSQPRISASHLRKQPGRGGLFPST